MATVDATAVTRIHSVEGAITLTSIGGGAGGGANTEIFIQGAQSAGRKQSNVTDHGFWLTVDSQDVSPAGTHVGVWINHIHYAVLTLLRVRLGSTIGSTTAGFWDGHNVPLSEYPATGGWIRAWIDVDRTPEATGDSGALVQTALIGMALVASLPAVGGNAPNIIMDASDFTTSGLLLTGTSGVWNDFVAADEGNGTNKYGVVVTKGGIIYCFARLTLGSASSLAFNDSDFVIVFPQQATVASTFMGITTDLQHISTAITWTNGVIKSAGSVQGDLIVTGISGSLTASSMAFSALRVAILTSTCSITGSSFASCGAITPAGATLTGTSVLTSAVAANASALVWNVNTNTDGKLDNMTYSKGAAAHHAIEIGTSGPLTFTLRGITFTGFNAADGQNDSVLYLRDRGGDQTWNISANDCIGAVSIKKERATDTVNFTQDTKVLTVHTQDAATGSAVNGVRVLVLAASGGPYPFEVAVSIARSGATATVTHAAHGLVTGHQVVISGCDQGEYNGLFAITKINDDSYSYTVSGSPATPATGSPKSTFIIVTGTTAGSGDISSTARAYASSQPYSGTARYAAGPYRPSPISGTISAATQTVNIPMISDA